MGLFSKWLPAGSDLSYLSDDEIRSLRFFFDRGWAADTRRVTGNSNDLADALIDQKISRGLKKRSLSKEELDMTIALMKAHLDYHGKDEEGTEILRKLRMCRDEL